MSVDYGAEFGLGYEVICIPGISTDDYIDYLDELVAGSAFKAIMWGNFFTGTHLGWAIVLKEIPDISNISEYLRQIQQILTEKRIEFDSSTYVVGGASTS